NKIYVIAELWSRLIGEVILMPHETEFNYSVLSAWDSNLTVMRLFFCLHPFLRRCWKEWKIKD
ncbi:hypothetical protein, partial [Brotocaccenecus cirricatena]|uniref:hypothetical protein n=1 Tax=Brotocaccenecus cirricatena TaxID=3064195 RepID=UPI0032C04F13